MSQLTVSGISKSFGALRVIDRFDLDLAVGERHAIIGPNGAGKTTLFNMISGWIAPDSGRIEIEGLDITGRPQQAVTQAGLARSFQKNTLFDELSVAESLRLAVQAHSPARFNFFQPARRFGALRSLRAHGVLVVVLQTL